MSGTVAAATKAKLVGRSNVLTAVVGSSVKVSYKFVRDVSRKFVYGGHIGGPVDLSAMKGGGSNRVRRQEELSLQLFVRVYEPGDGTGEDADAEAAAIATLIEEYVAANTTLDGSITGLKGIYESAFDLAPFTEDEGSGSVAVLTFTVKSFLV